MRRRFLLTLCCLLWLTSFANAQFPGLLPTPASTSGHGTPPLTNLWAWYKTPIVGKSNGDTVSTWPDSSGNGRDATRNAGSDSGSPAYATNQINSLDAVDCYVSTARGQFDIPDLSGLSAGSIYFVLKGDASAGAGSNTLGRMGTSGQRTEYRWVDTHIYNDLLTTARKDEGVNSFAINTWHLFEVLSGSADFRDYQNGTAFFSTGTNTFGGFATPFFCGFDVLEHWEGFIAEVLIYTVVHDTTARQAVEAYVSARYAFGF